LIQGQRTCQEQYPKGEYREIEEVALTPTPGEQSIQHQKLFEDTGEGH